MIRSRCVNMAWLLLGLATWTRPAFGTAAPLKASLRTGAAQAAARGSSIELETLLNRVLNTHPKLAETKAKARAAKAKIRGAKGAFDPKLAVDAKVTPAGRYENRTVGAKLGWLSPYWGIGGFLDYRLGRGKFPVYQQDKATGSIGRVKAGLSFPILAGRRIGPARAKLQRSRLRLAQQRCVNDQVRLDILERAAKVYWEWVSNALEVAIRRSLLSVAKARDAALNARLESGAIAKIVLLDNQRLIIERESKLIEAQGKLGKTGIKMSLYWRDLAGDPVTVRPDQVPARFDANDPHAPRRPRIEGPSRQEIEDALNRLPGLCKLRQDIAQARLAVDLARNNRLPDLDLQGYASRYFGKDVDFAPTDLGVGVEFRVALGMRKVTGAWRAAHAKLDALLYEQRRVRDQKRALLQQAQVEVQASYGLLEIADRRVVLSAKMAAAERAKFEQGASDLVVVNLREQALANAQRDRVLAWSKFEQARIAAFRALGLDPLGRSTW